MPGTKNNRNPMKHGLCMALGKGPNGSGYVQRLMYSLRRQLRAAIVELRGETSIVDEAHIQTACRWERHALLAQRWLNREFENLDPEQRIKFSAEVGKASEKRDAAIKALNIKPQNAESVWEQLDFTRTKPATITYDPPSDRVTDVETKHDAPSIEAEADHSGPQRAAHEAKEMT